LEEHRRRLERLSTGPCPEDLELGGGSLSTVDDAEVDGGAVGVRQAGQYGDPAHDDRRSTD